MKQRLSRRFSIALLILFGLGFGMGVSGNVLAQSYPSKTIHIVVPYPPGGIIDMVTRLIGKEITKSWHQPVVVKNEPGAGGNIGANSIAKAAPDGYHLLVTTSGIAIAPSLYRHLPFNPLKDLTPISQICTTHLVLVVNTKVRAKSVKQLIALAKSEPGKLTDGNAGIGSPLQLTMDLWKEAAGANILSVPFKGSAPLGLALMKNEVNMAFLPPEIALRFTKKGKLRPLTISGKERSPLLPNVPTIAQTGIRPLGVPGWYGMFAPGRMPPKLAAMIQAKVAEVLQMPAVKDRIISVGAAPVGSTPDQFAAKYRADIATFKRIVRNMNIPQR